MQQESSHRMKKQHSGNWVGASLLVAVLAIVLVGGFLVMPKFRHHDILAGAGGQTATPLPSPTPTLKPSLIIPGASSYYKIRMEIHFIV